MADDESLEGKRNLALQTVNIPLTEKLMFTPSPENALDTRYPEPGPSIYPTQPLIC